MPMERIKRALELARAERAALLEADRKSRGGSDTASQVAASVGTPGANAGESGTSATGRFPKGRFVSVDAEHLRQARVLRAGLSLELVDGRAGLSAVQSYKMLRTQVLQRMHARRWNSLAVLSPTPQDGKTLTALNLAIAIAADPNHSAVLVDFDLRLPALAPRLGITEHVQSGIERALTGQAPLADVAIRLLGYDNLTLFPAGGPVPASSELLASEGTRRIVAELRGSGPERIVIYDMPPVLGADDALAFLPQVDAVLLVLGESHTRSNDVTRTFELLRDKPVLGTVLNKSRSDASAAYAYAY